MLKMIEMSTVKPGDTVLVFIDESRKFVVKVSPGKILGTDKGFIRHDELVGKPYGGLVETSLGVKALLLHPLRLDYMSTVKRITQIIYPKDASLMIYYSGVKPGSTVGEAGVGTGVITLSLAELVGDQGVVYGFDINEKALENVRLHLELYGLDHRVRLARRDVREPVGVSGLDSFFLDIPDPWNALRSVYEALKPSGTLIAYVPTVNQVEKTILSLRSHGGFADIHAYEVMLREYSVEEGATRPQTLMVGHTGFIVFARKIIVS